MSIEENRNCGCNNIFNRYKTRSNGSRPRHSSNVKKI